MKANKWIALALSLTTALTLAGCGHEHEWADATCTEPKTCTVCGETEGEPLGHKMTDATYQAPATCEVCGETEGEPLTPDFVAYDLPLMALDTPYDCNLTCYNDPSKTTVAKVTASDYRIFESDETHPAKEGYEYRQVNITICCDDENANNYGVNGFFTRIENYYDILSLDNSSVNNDENNTVTFDVDYNGETCECVYAEDCGFDPWVGQTLIGHYIATVQVPVGFDGAVVGAYDRAIEAPDGSHIFDIYQEGRFLLFRMM